MAIHPRIYKVPKGGGKSGNRTLCSFGSWLGCWFVLVLLGNHAATPLAADEEAMVNQVCDACSFDGFDPSNCKVYGQLQSGDALIPWDLASESCLRHYHIHVQSFDPEIIASVWPEGVVEQKSSSSLGLERFMAWLEDDQSKNYKVVDRLKLEFLPNFFQREIPGRDDGPVVFHDRVELGATLFDCTAGTDGADCWTALRQYLGEIPEGQRAWVEMGKELVKLARWDKEAEQRSVRIAICADVNTARESICGTLVTQIHNEWRGNVHLDCGLYGNGPPPGVHRTPTGTKCRLDGGGAQPHHSPGSAKTRSSATRMITTTTTTAAPYLWMATVTMMLYWWV